VLISGIFIIGSYYSFTDKIDHGDTFLVAYIPAIMLFSRWDSNYSVDALLRAKRGITVRTSDSSWHHIWPMRATLVLLSLMYFGAAYLKLRGGWLTDTEAVSKILLNQNAIAVLRLETPNPLNLVIAGSPAIHIPLQFSALLFELLFFLSIFHRQVRNLFVSAGLVFHGFNAFFLNVNAHTIIILYLVFVDWQAVYSRLWPKSKKPNFDFKQLPTAVILGISVLAVLVVAALWIDKDILDPLYPILNARAIWYFVTPVALAMFIKSLLDFLKRVLARPRLNARRDALAPSSVTKG
jgi:hypothetical protein